MPIDPYTPCPGGTGKKIKFCCSDLVGELDKIQRMLEGDQRTACLDHIESLDGKYPQRACLMSIKAMLKPVGRTPRPRPLGRVRSEVSRQPGSPGGEGDPAGDEGGFLAGLGPMQDALERCNEHIPPAVYDAIGLIAQTLVADNQLIAARATWCCKSAWAAPRISGRFSC